VGEPLAGPAGQQDDEDVVEVHGFPKGGDDSTRVAARLRQNRRIQASFDLSVR